MKCTINSVFVWWLLTVVNEPLGFADRSVDVRSHGDTRRRIRNAVVPARSRKKRATKQMRSRTAAAITQSFISCWSLSVWRRRLASLRSLFSSRSRIEPSRCSTELAPSAVEADAAADDGDNEDDMLGLRWLTLCHTSTPSEPVSAAASVSGLLFSPPSLAEVIFVQPTYSNLLDSSLLTCSHDKRIFILFICLSLLCAKNLDKNIM